MPLGTAASPIAAPRFAAWLDRLGPFEERPRLAVAVSGGADSLALTLLAQRWAASRGGSVIGFTVDHGLRPEARSEAEVTGTRLAGLGIAHGILRLQGLTRGPALAARARAARYAALEHACASAGILHLLLGHHAADQAETRMMRLLRGSGPDGLAGMAALVETPMLRLLRPLLEAPPAALRATLRTAGLGWVEDSSNRDSRTLRTRLRLALADPEGTGPTVAWHADQAATLGAARRRRDSEAAHWLGRHVRLHPEGFAILLAPPDRLALLGRVIRQVAGTDHPPSDRALGRWLRAPRATTLGGTVLRPAGRLAPGGWLIAREPAVIPRQAAGRRGELWDGRLRVVVGEPRAGSARLPHLLRRTLPDDDPSASAAATWCWWPRAELAGAGFAPARPLVQAPDADRGCTTLVRPLC